MIFNNQVSFFAIDFDVNPPTTFDSSAVSSGVSVTLAFPGGFLQANAGAREAIWTAASAPSYAQCRLWVKTNAGNGQDLIENGMQLCVESAAGRIIYLKVIDADASDSVLTADAKVWRS